jgi:hypothetical protein
MQKKFIEIDKFIIFSLEHLFSFFLSAQLFLGAILQFPQAASAILSYF